MINNNEVRSGACVYYTGPTYRPIPPSALKQWLRKFVSDIQSVWERILRDSLSIWTQECFKCISSIIQASLWRQRGDYWAHDHSSRFKRWSVEDTAHSTWCRRCKYTHWIQLLIKLRGTIWTLWPNVPWLLGLQKNNGRHFTWDKTQNLAD
jgi:hypothetical protein